MIEADFLASMCELSISDSAPGSKSRKRNDVPNKSKSKKPRGGYRPILVGEGELVEEAKTLAPLMQFIYDKDDLSDQDKVSYFTLAYISQRYPANFLENVAPIIDEPNGVSSQPLDKLPFTFSQKVNTKFTNLKIKTLFDVVNNFNLHSVPYSARFTLVNWYLGGKFDLVLMIDRIPSSKQVLKMQANGKRCVSLIGT